MIQHQVDPVWLHWRLIRLWLVESINTRLCVFSQSRRTLPRRPWSREWWASAGGWTLAGCQGWASLPSWPFRPRARWEDSWDCTRTSASTGKRKRRTWWRQKPTEMKIKKNWRVRGNSGAVRWALTPFRKPQSPRSLPSETDPFSQEMHLKIPLLSLGVWNWLILNQATVFQLFISLWNRYRQSFADIKLIQIRAFPASYSRQPLFHS